MLEAFPKEGEAEIYVKIVSLEMSCAGRASV